MPQNEYPQGGIESPAKNARAVAAGETLPHVTRGVCFSTAGTLVVRMEGGQLVHFESGALAAGVIHPLRIRRILAASTASGIVVVW